MKLYNLLEHLSTKRKMIAIYCNQRYTDRFWAGHICGYDEYALLLSLINTKGDPEGSCLFNANEIYRMEYDSQYLLKLDKGIFEVPDLLPGEAIHSCFWEYAKENMRIVQIRRIACRQSIAGRIVDYDDRVVYLQRILRNGTMQKEHVIQYSDIVWASLGTASELSLERKIREEAET